ncbi:MAG: glycosyltransferase, partial [Blastocatellia bacterium]|nr:glycosyltransferase [Blastocatellia bacterium]
TYNRLDLLSSCLISIATVDYPFDKFEVVVVDDGSKTAPDEVVLSFQTRFKLSLIKQKNSGPASARNRGANNTVGDYLIFIDDDSIVSKNWLKELNRMVLEKPDCAIGGAIENALPNNLYATASETIVNYLYSQFNKDLENANFFVSNNLVVSKNNFLLVKGFDTNLEMSEDREFCKNWLAKGFKLCYAEKAVIYHQNRANFKAYWKQQFVYGRGAYRFNQICQQRFQNSSSLNKHSFYIDLLAFPFKKFSYRHAFPIMVLILLSQIAVFTGYFYEKIFLVYKPLERKGLTA